MSATTAASTTPRGGAGWRDRLPPTRTVLLALVAAHVLLKLLMYPYVAHAPLIGDETSYVNGGRALSNAVRDLVAFSAPDTAELQRNVVSSGWFMPGMMLVLAPLFVVAPDAPVELVRGYLGLCSTAFFLFTVLAVRRAFGARYAAALLVLPGLVPMWLVFSFGAWGDLAAGMLVAVFLTRVVPLMQAARRGVPPTLRQGIELGLWAIAVVYWRSSAAVLVVGLCAVLGLLVLLVLRGRERGRGVLALALAGVAFLGVLAPWSLAASSALDDRVLTTTSVANGKANTFGNRAEVCFGPCDPNSTLWFAPVRYSREVARATGLSELEVQEQMSAYARRDVTAQSFTSDVLDNLGNYLFKPAAFARYLRSPDAVPDPVLRTVEVSSAVMVHLAQLATLAMMLTVFRSSFRSRFLSLSLTLGVGALLLQPLFHVAGGRYWTTAAPMMGLAAALLASEVLARRGARGRRGRVPTSSVAGNVGDVALARWLDRAQVALAVGLVLAVTTLVVLAR